jgi:acetyltransferase-like isoleucine patch superfamily enzyme
MNFATAYRLFHDVRDRAFSGAMASSFAGFGARSRLSMPTQLHGVERMTIGSHVYLGPGCWLLTHAAGGELRIPEPGGRLEIGDGTSIAGYCVLSAAVKVQIGRRVLFARNIYVADHRHGFDGSDVAVLDMPADDMRPVTIGDGAWLGQNVVVLPGVTIGRHAIIGANSVVRDDVPAHSVAVGAPARVVRTLVPGVPQTLVSS